MCYMDSCYNIPKAIFHLLKFDIRFQFLGERVLGEVEISTIESIIPLWSLKNSRHVYAPEDYLEPCPKLYITLPNPPIVKLPLGNHARCRFRYQG